MPTYDYKCNNCDHTFEIFQSMKDEKLTKCPVCQKDSLQRLIGAGSGLIFKGSGFYLTDYKNKSSEISSSSGTSSKESKTDKGNSSNYESKASTESKQPAEAKTGSDSNQSGKQEKKTSDVKTTSEKTSKGNKTADKK